MDRKGYYAYQMIPKIKEFFPEVVDALTVSMLDKRLRQLDQIPELDYFKPSARELTQEASAKEGNMLLTPPKSNRRGMVVKENSPFSEGIVGVSWLYISIYESQANAECRTSRQALV